MPNSQNGWTITTDPARLWNLPHISGRVLAGPVWVVLYALCCRFAVDVEQITRRWSWGYSYRRIAGSRRWSNHASGTAVDLNAPLHSAGRSRTFSPSQTVAIRGILDDLPVLRWGAAFRDEMHFEIAPGVTLDEVDQLAVSLLQTALNSTERTAEPGEPLPELLEVDGVRGPKTEDALRTFQAGAGLTVDGIDGPATWAALTPQEA